MHYDIMKGNAVVGGFDVGVEGEVYSLTDYSRDCIRTESLLPEVRIDASTLTEIIKNCQTVDVLKRSVFYDTENGGTGTLVLGGADCRLLHGALGVITEGGELLERLLGARDDVNVMEEVGDLMWYVGILLDELASRGTSINDVLRANIAKLRKRYPDKFSSQDALNRDLDVERRTLEGSSVQKTGEKPRLT